MIVFNLICKICSVEFEGWFENTKEFNNQKRKKIINCPSCDSTSITKSLSAPNLPAKNNSKKNIQLKKAFSNNIKKYKKIVEKNFEYVGDKFTEEAKKMKYGEKEEKPIYGEATIEQTKELAEEEINVVPLPWAPTKKTN
ncbi:MAG: DUF1178 family protein [Pelagibacteraceae bacterium]|nr:DUF1178 family protein [Pelagibacteraceae bacterium]HJO14413.1 DUF1178 family protein [Alphaproteobacteria bacterium]MBO6466990.1 DUF1178 family protein [Pelagibacteraceae bacterium]MBO6467980.1 DUF1178 family protein [Pelagibacteraceae bacterium]MBO6468985.1 DUF1178 family protein [Pelagibacteraceae bacterium]